MAKTTTTASSPAPVVDVSTAISSVMFDEKKRRELMREHVRGLFNKSLAATPNFEEALTAVFTAGVTAGQAALAAAPRTRKPRKSKAAANGATQAGDAQQGTQAKE